MNQVTRYSAPDGYLYQVISDGAVSSDLTPKYAYRMCEFLGDKFVAAFRIARDCADATRVTVPA